MVIPRWLSNIPSGPRSWGQDTRGIFASSHPVKHAPVPILSPKRQVTLPKKLCDQLQVAPGDDLQILEYEGRITILKRAKGASGGVLGHVNFNRSVSDADSRDDAMTKAGRGGTKQRRRPTRPLGQFLSYDAPQNDVITS